MACSPAQRESNRRNALRSTGPRTPEGKSRSRRNGLKHGLTGQGIVLPSEDVAEIDQLFETLDAEMAPNGEMARRLVKRAAFLFVRLDRCTEHDSKATAYRMRHAPAEFDDARLAEAEKLLSWIMHEPSTNARRLRNSPEGIDLLIRKIEGLRDDLGHEEYVRWDWRHCEDLHHLMGKRPLDLPITRARALSDAVGGKFEHLESNDRPELERIARQCWAAHELLELIQAEVDNLKALRAGLDLEGLELDRSEAPARAMFDTSKEAVLARKYEAAAERGLFRTLKEFRQVQTEFPPPKPEPTEPEIPDELGSSLPDVPEEEDEEAIVDETTPEPSQEIEVSIVSTPEIVLETDDIDDR